MPTPAAPGFRPRAAIRRGRGGATADITFRLEPTDQGTQVLIDTELILSGSVAQYGRGGRHDQ